MKRPIWMRALALVLAMLLTGCATNTPSGESTTPSTTNTPETTDTTESGNTANTDHTHKHSATEVVAATCTAEGYTVYVCDCGDTYNDDFTEKAEHTYEETVIPPTAESEGYTLYMCTVCNHAYKDSKISAADFIAKIDIYHEYPDFAHKKETPPTGDSTFREKVKRDLNFDPNRHYEDMMFLELRLDENGLPEDGAKWIVQTAQEQRGAERLGDTSLVEQIEKLPKKKPE